MSFCGAPNGRLLSDEDEAKIKRGFNVLFAPHFAWSVTTGVLQLLLFFTFLVLELRKLNLQHHVALAGKI
eukprot:6046496-Amphidinium_carterae.1